MCTPTDQKSDEVEMLIKKSQEAKGCAYSPYSKCSTGAALLTENGRTFTGCSIENSCPGLSACAESVAIFKAVSEGCTKFKSLAVCSDRRDYVPCGSCRQVLREFGDKTEVHMTMQDGSLKTMTIADLLPTPFGK
ncbi:cytidine deaminase-like [Hypanus sabinus]|uniref:cytidine deaminase-like n=1 Tax=Hypanus sabinus TaxID=79690 RepID=UPI0028C45F17|nr:cytidine deaminase-like [Hypanus sabinus]